MSESVKAGTWVEIEKIILTPDQRAPQVPEDTRCTPYIMKMSGFLQSDSKIGDIVAIKTLIGRTVEGELKIISPCYRHDFGETVEELLNIGLGGQV